MQAQLHVVVLLFSFFLQALKGFNIFPVGIPYGHSHRAFVRVNDIITVKININHLLLTKASKRSRGARVQAVRERWFLLPCTRHDGWYVPSVKPY